MVSTTTEWLMQRPKWMQVAAKLLLEFGDLNDAVISDLAVLCQKEANNDFTDVDCSIPAGTFNVHDFEEIRLCSISEVAGINKLAPQTPLDFGNSNMAVIYGANGSGKSGYVRLLKHICGSRDCIRGKLYKNVFISEDTEQKAKISFLKNNTHNEHNWTGRGVCDDLCSVNIFDTSFGQVFMGKENEVRYEPPVLSFFSKLIAVCEKVSEKIDTEISILKSKMPQIPHDLLGSPEISWVEQISAKTTTDDLDSHCSFSPENEKELQNILVRQAETSPMEKAQKLKEKAKILTDHIKLIQSYFRELSQETWISICSAKDNLDLKKRKASIAKESFFSNTKLEGVGSDTWKQLWLAARKYSEEVAYTGQQFPHVQDNSVCVLCHQPLSEDSKQRFLSFESYIQNKTQKEVIEAEETISKIIMSLPNIPDIDNFEATINLIDTNTQEIMNDLSNIIKLLQNRKSKMENANRSDDLKPIDQPQNYTMKLFNIQKGYIESAKKYEEDAKKDNRVELQSKFKNLQAKKWLTEQKRAIQEEVNRLQSIKRLQEAKKKTNSRALSTKKGELAETPITDAFVQRFNNELKTLGATQIKVKLIKSKVSKGKVLHTLQLDGATHNLNEVLSEGENRIVSIAAFLADVTGRTYLAPFVFDDPISSLDMDYEEAVVQRLCAIASERQVIIFTHRLSLLGMVQDYAKKVSIEPKIICIREESWGTGEPGDTPLFAKKPDKALNQLINDRLSKAKKLLNEHGKEVYEPYAKALCSDFRILLERMIECELIADVVQRYRRAINTMGKIGNLAKISEADCTYFDDLMTKYSRYEHSQPLEAPVPLPEPHELETDFTALKNWQTEFKKRPLTPALQEVQ